MITVDDFYDDLIQGVISSADSRGILKPEAFLEEISTYLMDDAELSENFEIADYKKTGLEVHGYDIDLERGVLTLVVDEFFQTGIQTLTRDMINTKFKRVKTFFQKALQGLYREMEESSPAYSMAYEIFNNKDRISKVRFFIISDGKITSRSEMDFPLDCVDSYEAEYRIFDIERIYKIYLAKSEQSFSIDIQKLNNGASLPCLIAPTQSSDYDAYLLVVPGLLLYEIYDLYGQKLLEENVRTFLQFKGKVNQGLAITIGESPDKFFAYNNGLTATAKSVELDTSGDIPKLLTIDGLQIVNGGQTTSAIYAAKKNKKLDISKIFVQMKLSIVRDQEQHHDFVSKVSEYANTQNKVNASDFFANSPFHQDFKGHSERIYAPSLNGLQRKTKWFYERARGQYLNEQAYLTKATKASFLKDYPKEQLVEKTLLAKSENSWRMVPFIVSKGAQSNFIKFAEDVTKQLDANKQAITEKYFRDAISKIIIFKATEKIVSNASWYDGGYRAQTVTYTIALLSYIFHKNNKTFNFSKIWKIQCVPNDLTQAILDLAGVVYSSLINPAEGIANVTQWAKQPRCWERIKAVDVSSIEQELIEEYSADREEVLYEKKEAASKKKIDNSIEMQTFVLSVKMEVWSKIYNYFNRNTTGVSPTDISVLSSLLTGRIKCPSPNQAKCLYRIYTQAEHLGMALK